MINQELQIKLRSQYNPDGSKLRIMQLQMLEILKYVDGLCRKHEIPYWLSAGTLLGAVRHGGFIPWDDDVDIELCLSDYNRLVNILRAECDERFVLQDHKSDSAFMWPFCKLRIKDSVIKENGDLDVDYRYHGVFIDIFPMAPSNSLLVHRFGGFLMWLCLCNHHIKIKALRRLYRKFVYFIAFRLIAPPMRALSSIRAQGKLREQFGGILHDVRDMEDIFPLSTISFEGYDCLAPKDTDAYLKKLFGDYMSLPKDRGSHMSI